MAQLKSDPVEGAGGAGAVRLTTTSRKSGKEHKVTIRIATDGSRVYIWSGSGLRRHRAQNVMARATSAIYGPRYGISASPSKPDQPLSPGKEATSELIPLAW